ncbi:hypothetical protein ABK040_006656 [Willaertia magna]
MKRSTSSESVKSISIATSSISKSISTFDLTSPVAPVAASVYHQHKYPSYMQNLSVCKSLQKQEEVKKLNTILNEKEELIDDLEKQEIKYKEMKVCYIAFIKLHQKAANLKSYIESNELKPLYQILKNDRDELRKKVKEMENERNDLLDDIQQLDQELKQTDRSIQQFHLFIEETFKNNHSIDNIHERFEVLDKDDQTEAYNIPCTHPTLLRGMLHIYTNYLAFESIVIMNDNEERTIVIPLDHIQQMSKSHTYLHDCGIVLHVTKEKSKQANREKIEFNDFKSTEARDKAFDLIFSLAFNAKE